MKFQLKTYPKEAIEKFTQHVYNDTAAFNWLILNNYKELIATLDAIRDDKKAFNYLIKAKHYHLAAFVNAVWDDEEAMEFLIKIKQPDWAACAKIIDGDEQAEKVLLKLNKKHFVDLAYAIQSRIREDGDRFISPIHAFTSILNIKKHLKDK
ncbi:MAG: hypothetical protein KatS3mg028_0827 [Bacteroidia bacterium]|nr:MAG: hypothetical protein KatS3mg028_0827 [Bacteroidia bacterium]